MNIAIIGAGLAGLTLARRLAPSHKVIVFEKARGPGGRMSTRRATPYAFDHGAQYFTAETAAFETFIKQLEREGRVAQWPKQLALSGGARVSDKAKYVAVPGMNAICKHLAEGLDLRTQTQVEGLQPAANKWQVKIRDVPTLDAFDWVISTAPAAQSVALMPPEFSQYGILGEVRMQACFALMLGFEAPLDLPWQAMKSGAGPIGWMAVDASKAGRPESMSLLIQSSNDWAEANFGADPDLVTEQLIKVAGELMATDLSSARHQVLHRWRYAATAKPAGQRFLVDDKRRLAACGDWCLGGKVEAAFTSANALADHILSLTKT
jgi:renalase